MSYTVEKVASNRVKILFTLPAEQFDEAMGKAYLKVRGKISVPGFRRGKAPRKLIENMYGESVFYDDAFELLVPDAYAAAIREAALNPVDRPDMDIKQIGAGKELQFTAEVYVKPDVTLGEYKGLQIDKQVQKVTEEAVNARIEQDVEKTATTMDITDRTVDTDDIVNLDYLGTVDGKAFEGGTANGQKLTIGSNSFIEGFEQQLIGMAIGEEKDLQVTFPENYHAEALKGKPAVFHVKINGIQKKVRPELDDEFAADVSEFVTFAEYRASIEGKLAKEADDRADAKMENDLIRKVTDAASCDIPKAMIDDEVSSMIEEMQMRMAYQGLRYQDYLKYTGMTEDGIKEMYAADAKERVKTRLVIEAIRKAEGIEPDDEDCNKIIAQQAERAGREAGEFKASLKDNQMEYIRDSAAVQKTVDFLRASAVITVTEEVNDTPKDTASEEDGSVQAENEETGKSEVQ